MNSLLAKSLPVVLLSGALLALPSCTVKPDPKIEHAQAATFETGVPGSTSVDTTTALLTIAWVHQEPRELVLDYPDGKRETVKCGPSIVNFDQFRAGDQIKVILIKEIAVAMGTESDPPDGSKAAVVLAPKGGAPGGLMANVTQVTATVSSINLTNHTASLVFPDGTTHEVSVRPDVDLTLRKVGEKVVIRKTDIMAIGIEKQKPQ